MIKLGSAIAVGDMIEGKLVSEHHVYELLGNNRRVIVYTDGTTESIGGDEFYNVVEPQKLDEAFATILKTFDLSRKMEIMCAIYVLLTKLGMTQSAEAINDWGIIGKEQRSQT